MYARVCVVHGGQRKALDSLELEVLMVVGYHVRPKNSAWSSERVAAALNH